MVRSTDTALGQGGDSLRKGVLARGEFGMEAEPAGPSVVFPSPSKLFLATA